MTIATKMKIGPKNPIRRLVHDLPDYWDSKGDFISAVSDVLDDCDLEAVWSDLDGDEGRANLTVRPKDSTRVCCDVCEAQMGRNSYDNWLVLTWYRVSANRIEIISYVS